MSDGYDVPPGSPFALLSREETRAWFAYQKLQLRLTYEMNRQLQSDSELSLPDYDLMVALTSDQHGRMSISALAVRVGWERSRTSHHAKRMEGRALVRLSASRRDRRVTEVELTTRGWEVLRDASTAHVALVRRMFLDRLTPRTMQQLSETLEHVYDGVIEHGTLPRPEDHP